MRAHRFLPVVLLGILAFLLAGCGGGASVRSGGSSMPEGASLVRAGVLAFVSIDSDLGSDQWQQLDELTQKFPGRDKAVAKLEQAFSEKGVDFETDVKPALGPEVDIAVVTGGSSSSTRAVALTKPEDAGKLKALVAKLNARGDSGERAVYREVDGWYALSDSQAAISAVLAGDRPALADDEMFKEALGKLPGEALAKAYVDGTGVNGLAEQAASQSGGGLGAASLGLDTLKYLAVSASAESEGIRIRGASSGGNLGGGDFASKLFAGVPGDAFAFLGFRGEGTAALVDKLKATPQVGEALSKVQEEFGVSLERVLSLLQGEVAFYARPGALIPELTLVLDERDVSGALATLDKIAAHLAEEYGAHVETGTQGGHAVKTITFGAFAVHYGAVDNTVVITSGSNGIADFGGSGERLPDSADFKEAKDAAGMPDSTGGFVYLDLKDALPLLESFAGLSGHGLSSDVTENLRPLRSLLAWSQGPEGSRTYDAFVEIK
jgi:Protein of unknown function (DUF3352)